jgi:hypothetical protein
MTTRAPALVAVVRVAFVALCGLVALAAGCGPGPRSPTAEPLPDPALLRALSVLATGVAPPPAELDRTRARMSGGALTVAGYIDELLASPRFASDVAPLIMLRQLLSQDAFAAPEGYVLKSTGGPRPVYYLYTACRPDDAVAVTPWWSLIEGRTETVAVCPDSYRPQQWIAQVRKGEPEVSCLSEYGGFYEEGSRCGCGPSLIRCFDSAARQKVVVDSLRDELRRTVEHNVRGELPIEGIFTSNETFRDRHAELVMRSYTIENARDVRPEAALRELAAWPAGGAWAPRADLAPGQNAGILTAPHVAHFTLDRRQRMTAIYDALWCIEADSVGATPETLLSITGADLQLKNDGWKELAARPICTNCHARLDYGFQFFLGFPNGNLHAYFKPELQRSGRGPLYMRDIDDPRGEAELTPQGFARLAVAQPEFRRCVARNFVEYVLGDRVTPAEVDAVEAAIRPGATSARALMRASLQALVAAWAQGGPPAEAAPRPETAAAGAGTEATAASRGARPAVAMTEGLRAQLATHCLDCHEHQPNRPDFAAQQLERRTAVDALSAVAFGSMPKDRPLAEPARTQLIDALVATLWTGADAVAARSYFVGGMAALPAYRPEIAFELIHHGAGARDAASPASSPAWRMIENAVRPNVQQVTPGLVTVTTLEAIAACRTSTKTRAERDRCISETVRLSNLSSRRR